MRWLPHLFLYSLALQTIHSPVSPLIKVFELRVKQPQVRTIFLLCARSKSRPELECSVLSVYSTLFQYIVRPWSSGQATKPLNNPSMSPSTPSYSHMHLNIYSKLSFFLVRFIIHCYPATKQSSAPNFTGSCHPSFVPKHLKIARK
ncbi:hypothetical protein DL95DRAFT_73236 [Leptodontidium sp. 2 PMI_412]|nr:hypothetical protein DL95DRAFT_73236 [Leptodontidium sp. 2 PMI_412]